MVILGIDPGYAIVGYGAVEVDKGRMRALGYGAITTPAGVPLQNRLLEIYPLPRPHRRPALQARPGQPSAGGLPRPGGRDHRR